MARPLRLEFPHAVYHVTGRGNARQDIVADDDERRRFLAVLAHVVDRYGWLCHAYCLMDNHYHLLIETPKPNLSQGMRQLNGLYTQASNRRHHRVGHLFQGRFKAVLVEKEPHLLELCRYVVLNPVRAKVVPYPRQCGLRVRCCNHTNIYFPARLHSCRRRNNRRLWRVNRQRAGGRRAWGRSDGRCP